jgi:4-methyl-5(b-hydroxyethyl)-thiazole monophosphate biosynthesis
MKIKMLIAEGFEEIEAITLIDILRRANYNLKTVSINRNNEIQGAHKIKVITDMVFDDVNFDDTDILILPGGVPGVPNLASEDKVLNLVKKFYDEKKYLVAICAAPFVLERANILLNKNVTCYPTWEDKINSGKIKKTNVVVDNNIITARGIGAAIDLGLKLVEIFSSKRESKILKSEIVYKK